MFILLLLFEIFNKIYTVIKKKQWQLCAKLQNNIFV